MKQFSKKITTWIGTPTSIAVHTIIFIVAFTLALFGVSIDQILLVLTTVVSLEAIYLAIFIQMTVNQNLASVEAVQEEVKEIGDDVEEISEEVEEISEDIDKIYEEEKQDNVEDEKTKMTLSKIEDRLQRILSDIETLKGQK